MIRNEQDITIMERISGACTRDHANKLFFYSSRYFRERKPKAETRALSDSARCSPCMLKRKKEINVFYPPRSPALFPRLFRAQDSPIVRNANCIARRRESHESRVNARDSWQNASFVARLTSLKIIVHPGTETCV